MTETPEAKAEALAAATLARDTTAEAARLAAELAEVKAEAEGPAYTTETATNRAAVETTAAENGWRVGTSETLPGAATFRRGGEEFAAWFSGAGKLLTVQLPEGETVKRDKLARVLAKLTAPAPGKAGAASGEACGREVRPGVLCTRAQGHKGEHAEVTAVPLADEAKPAKAIVGTVEADQAVKARRKSRAKAAPVETRAATPAERAAKRALADPGPALVHAHVVLLDGPGLYRAACQTRGCTWQGAATGDWFAANREGAAHVADANA